MRFEISKFLKQLLFPVAVVAVLQLNAAKVESLEIIQDGENKIPQELLNLTMRLRPGSEYSREYLDQDIKNLYATGKISDVVANVETLKNGKVAIKLQVKPSPVITVMNIEGNVKFETKELQALLTVMRENASAAAISMKHWKKSVSFTWTKVITMSVSHRRRSCRTARAE